MTTVRNVRVLGAIAAAVVLVPIALVSSASSTHGRPAPHSSMRQPSTGDGGPAGLASRRVDAVLDLAAPGPMLSRTMSRTHGAGLVSHPTSSPRPTHGASTAGHASRQTTAVSGGLISVPTAVPTSADAAHFDFTGVCPEEWTGSWTGASTCDITYAHVDPATGAVEGTIVDTFTGVYMGDHSRGTLTLDETFTGNVFTGAGVLKGVIVASGGDPTFACSSGEVTIPVYLNAVGSYGGYRGTWSHGCPAASEASRPRWPQPFAFTSHDPHVTPVAGGVISVPTFIPTSLDPGTWDFTGLGTVEWTGTWTGVSVANVTWAHFDQATGEGTATMTDTFTGENMEDHSHGSITLNETVVGNIITGAGIVEGDIVASSGDPTFQCARGHVTFPIYINAAGVYGGFYGNWIHGCTRGR